MCNQPWKSGVFRSQVPGQTANWIYLSLSILRQVQNFGKCMDPWCIVMFCFSQNTSPYIILWWEHNLYTDFWCDFDRASLLICGNKMPTRCNRGFYCRSYCLLNMVWVPLCPSSGAQEYYTVVAACGISCCGFQVAGLVWSWGLCVRFAGCCI